MTFLERLQPWEAHHVLRELVGARPELAPLAEEIARALLKEVSCEQVAQEVEDSVRSLDIEDLDSGPTPFGYTELAEAAWEALDATVQPFVEDLKRDIDLALEAEADPTRLRSMVQRSAVSRFICVEPPEDAMAPGLHSSNSSTARPRNVRAGTTLGARPVIST